MHINPAEHFRKHSLFSLQDDKRKDLCMSHTNSQAKYLDDSQWGNTNNTVLPTKLLASVYSRTSGSLSSPPTGSQSFHSIFHHFLFCLIKEYIWQNLLLFVWWLEYSGKYTVIFKNVFLYVKGWQSRILTLEIWSNLTLDFRNTLKFKKKKKWVDLNILLNSKREYYIMITNEIIFSEDHKGKSLDNGCS